MASIKQAHNVVFKYCSYMLKRLLLDHLRRFRKVAMDKFALSIKALLKATDGYKLAETFAPKAYTIYLEQC